MKLHFEHEELYHYTSIDALYAICNSRTIRFTDYRYLNDTQELIFGIKQLESFINSYQGHENLSILQELLRWVKNNQSTYFIWRGPAENGGIITERRTCTDTKIYTLSLTHNPDNPFMWKNYAKEGCRIKLNSEKLFLYCSHIQDQYVSRGTINIIRGDVKYGAQVQLLPYTLLHLQKLEGDNNFILNAFNEFYQLCALHKAEKYTLENEYRIGFRFLDEWFVDNFAYDIMGQRRLVRKILPKETGKPQIELLNFPIGEIFESIVISPYLKDTFCLTKINELCSQTLGREIPVEFSLHTVEECEAAENIK